MSIVEMPERLAEVSILKIVLESKDLPARRGSRGAAGPLRCAVSQPLAHSRLWWVPGSVTLSSGREGGKCRESCTTPGSAGG